MKTVDIYLSDLKPEKKQEVIKFLLNEMEVQPGGPYAEHAQDWIDDKLPLWFLGDFLGAGWEISKF